MNNLQNFSLTILEPDCSAKPEKMEALENADPGKTGKAFSAKILKPNIRNIPDPKTGSIVEFEVSVEKIR